MDTLKKKFYEKSSVLKVEIKSLLKEYSELMVDDVNLGQIYGGARDIKMMVWETSELDAMEGIRFRNMSIPELKAQLPKGKDGKEPLPEALFWLMLVGEVPTQAEADGLTEEWRKRATVPAHVFTTLDALPANTHAMTQFSIAITAMQTESIFAARYDEGMPKDEYWDATYEDTMNLIARLPQVAAYIYRRTYAGGNHIAPSATEDW